MFDFSKFLAVVLKVLGLNDPQPVAPAPAPAPVPVHIIQSRPYDQRAALTKLIVTLATPFDTWYPNATDPNRVINAHIGPVSPSQAAINADLIINQANLHSLDLAVMVAETFVEAHWSADTYNHNLVEHKGVISFDGTDWGLAQNSGAVLKTFEEFAGMSEAAITAIVLSAPWSIERYGSTLVHLYVWAQDQLLTPGLAEKILALPDFCVHADMTNEELPYWLATSAYNAGEQGITDAIEAGGYKITIDPVTKAETKTEVHYGHNVIAFARQFRPLITAP